MDYYLGEIRMFAGNYAPEDWHICDGTTLSINTYQALFTVLGTQYGGDGVSTFGLPNLIGQVAVGQGQLAGGSTYVTGASGGANNVTLNAQTTAAHNHPFNVNSTAATTGDPNGSYFAQGNGTVYPDVSFYSSLPSGVTAPNGTLNPSAVSNQGGGQPHDNWMPYTGIIFIISLNGLFPSPS